ncbi:HEPN domain-containing protein [Nostoc sp. UCD121]|uniref:HEPN domain-containing protein n=1 Tax=Nostoc sp. UCD121 TaxID=2681305 RepID=UPI0016263205|nr:HEPN domain-containing protein [Nostoc sp. UCD121]MBC1222402.1 HEPN domain-containing protein [Nostoc sp. UCD120]MBC1275196.1 HEPN domain-containing protein [Nostoc sp. UCD121]MBC1294106.1 HEPN domain-containing protein [Nostoc sp. UCD122]
MTPEQLRLLEKAERSLQAAQELNQKGFAEFAASRGYYAMFYIATAFLEGEGLAYSKHSAVIAAFGERFARLQRVLREFHRYLIDAERTRLRADYNTDPNINQADAEQIIQITLEILNYAKANIDSLSS